MTSNRDADGGFNLAGAWKHMRPWATCLLAGCVYAVAVFAFGFVLGTIRVLVLAPLLGATGSVLLESPVILAASWILSRVTAQRFQVRHDVSARTLMGATALAVLICSELAVSVLVFRKPASEFVLGYGTVPGMIGLAAQVCFAVFPLAQARRY